MCDFITSGEMDICLSEGTNVCVNKSNELSNLTNELTLSENSMDKIKEAMDDKLIDSSTGNKPIETNSLQKEIQDQNTISNTIDKEDEDLENQDNNQTKTNDSDPNKSSSTHEENIQLSNTLPNYSYNWEISPKLLCSATMEYQPSDLYENFTKGCQWSPDGTCLLVPSEDFRIRIFDLPRELYSTKSPRDLNVAEFKAALAVKDGGTIYDSCWYPYMDSWNPTSCCFLSTSQESPVHLWDAFTGELRATYRAYNQVDEVEAALSIQFVNCAKEIWCGFKNVLRTFDINQPGRQVDNISFNKCFPNVTGLVSCIRENPLMPGLVAFGTYSKCIGLYKDGPICTFKTGNGVTQIEFSPCGTKLYSGIRRGTEFLCWDLRNPGTVLWSSENRTSDTNQRIQFSMSTDGSTIASGGTDGFVQIWNNLNATNLCVELAPNRKLSISKDCINGVSLHKSLPLLATSSGQRLCEDRISQRDNSVKLWWCSN